MTNRAILTATFSAAITTSLWCVFWPREESSRGTEFPTPPEKQKASWDPQSLDHTLRLLSEAKTPEEKLSAASRFNLIPTIEIPKTLESIPLMEKNRLTLAARVLLIRWASKDGAAAAEWIWRQIPDKGNRQVAFREVGATWAWHDPQGLARWAGEHYQKGFDQADTPPSNAPAIGFSQLMDACFWLVSQDPYLACMLRRKGGGTFSTQDMALATAIPTVEKVRQALAAYDGLEKLNSTRMTGDQMVPMALLRRWQELDPVDFASSPYGHVMPSTSYLSNFLQGNTWKNLPAEDRPDRANAMIAGKEAGGRGTGIHLITRQWVEIDHAAALSWIDSLPESDATTRNEVIASIIAPKAPMEAFARLSNQAPAAYRSSLAQMFDAWKKSHPGTSPDLSALDENARRTWQDLEVLAP